MRLLIKVLVVVAGVPWLMSIYFKVKGLAIPEGWEEPMMMVAVPASAICYFWAVVQVGYMFFDARKGTEDRGRLGVIFIGLMAGYTALFVGYGMTTMSDSDSLAEVLSWGFLLKNLPLAIYSGIVALLTELAAVGFLYSWSVMARRERERASRVEAQDERLITANDLNDELRANAARLAQQLEDVKAVLGDRGQVSVSIRLLWWLSMEGTGWHTMPALKRRFGGSVDPWIQELVEEGRIQKAEIADRFMYARSGLAKPENV